MHLASLPPEVQQAVEVRVEQDASALQNLDNAPLAQLSPIMGHHFRWATILQQGLGHQPHYIMAKMDGRVVGVLPLMLVKSFLFGRYLVSLPYLNSAGVLAEDESVAKRLLDRAVRLADELKVRFLELRHENEFPHDRLIHQKREKVHMRLPLPATADELWKSFKPKLRSQIRKGRKNGLTVHWGDDLLDDFYNVFSHNMRDLGTPVFGRRLFESILSQFNGDAELCTVRMQNQTLAAALLIHGRGVTEVPSASSLRRYNHTNANMLMYWSLLEQAIERNQSQFDFGRSTINCGTYRFKKQWGAQPTPAVWQYYLRKGQADDMRPEKGKFQAVIRVWRMLPVGLTRFIGPPIVRGIP